MLGFVILHYNTIDDTVKCAASILEHTQPENVEIVIIDNNSPNGTGKELEVIYKHMANVKVILNEENIGFSKANNIGCQYLIDHFKPQYVCVLNNDTYIEDKNFIEKIQKIYDKSHFDILGPKIWNTEKNFNHNPMSIVSKTSEVNQLIKKSEYTQKILDSKLSVLTFFYSRFLNKVALKNKGVFGAAIIFSKKYIQKYDKVFPEITFMYGEENFLYHRVRQDDLNMVFNNNITIYHNHSSSTRSAHKNIIDTWKFKNKYQLFALIELKKILEEKKQI